MEGCLNVNDVLTLTGTSRVVVFFSLRTSEDTKKTIEAAERLHEENVQVFVVAIGASFDEKEVHAIASKPHYVHLDYSFLANDLLYFKPLVGRKMCQGLFIDEPSLYSTLNES